MLDIYSNRNKELPDVYEYKDIPKKLRIQIYKMAIRIFGDVKKYQYQNENPVYATVHNSLLEEYGMDSFINFTMCKFDSFSLWNYFKEHASIEHCFDIIELVFGGFLFSRYYDKGEINAKQEIELLNERFKFSGIGYSLVNGKMIRVDNTYTHAEIVKPALLLLIETEEYKGANEEFLKAHECYRKNNYRDTILKCCMAFESLMKGICEKHSWEYKKDKDTAIKLVRICKDNDLFPDYLEDKLNNLCKILESGVSTIRNKEAGYGQGADIKKVNVDLASYVLHITASNLIFLAKCSERKLKQ